MLRGGVLGDVDGQVEAVLRPQVETFTDVELWAHVLDVLGVDWAGLLGRVERLGGAEPTAVDGWGGVRDGVEDGRLFLVLSGHFLGCCEEASGRIVSGLGRGGAQRQQQGWQGKLHRLLWEGKGGGEGARKEEREK